MNITTLNKFLSLLLIIGMASTTNAASISSARINYTDGNLDKALAETNETLSVMPNDTEALFLKAQILTQHQQINQAIKIYQQLVLIKPEHIEAYNNLAAIYASQGKLEHAKEMLERAIKTDPLFSRVHSNLQTVYMDISRKHYLLALKQTPQDSTTALVSIDTPEKQPITTVEIPEIPEIPVVPVLLSEVPIIAKTDPIIKDGPTIEIETAIQNWAKAWSSRDIDQYLNAYRQNYSAGGQTSDKWADSRRWSLSNSEYITVQLSNINIQADGKLYRAQFLQTYESDLLKEVSDKELVFVLQAGYWKITRENSGES